MNVFIKFFVILKKKYKYKIGVHSGNNLIQTFICILNINLFEKMEKSVIQIFHMFLMLNHL